MIVCFKTKHYRYTSTPTENKLKIKSKRWASTREKNIIRALHRAPPNPCNVHPLQRPRRLSNRKPGKAITTRDSPLGDATPPAPLHPSPPLERDTVSPNTVRLYTASYTLFITRYRPRVNTQRVRRPRYATAQLNNTTAATCPPHPAPPPNQRPLSPQFTFARESASLALAGPSRWSLSRPSRSFSRPLPPASAGPSAAPGAAEVLAARPLPREVGAWLDAEDVDPPPLLPPPLACCCCFEPCCCVFELSPPPPPLDTAEPRPDGGLDGPAAVAALEDDGVPLPEAALLLAGGLAAEAEAEAAVDAVVLGAAGPDAVVLGAAGPGVLAVVEGDAGF